MTTQILIPKEIILPEITRLRLKSYWTESELTQLILHYNANKSYKEISELINKTESEKKTKICRLKQIQNNN